MLFTSLTSHSAQKLPVQRAMPPLTDATAWLNSPPLAPADLRGKVVLVDFWTYTCVNWRRTLPWLRYWHEKYRDGLALIGVHTPEFGFERSLDNVRRESEAQGVDWPIAVDNGYALWDAFDNKYWPALYFVDSLGRIRHHQFGEDRYDPLENVIRQLLIEAGHEPAGRVLAPLDGRGAEAKADWANLRSPETYLGSARSGSFTSLRDVFADRRRLYAFPHRLSLNEWALAGDWRMNEESSTSQAGHARIAFQFHARDVHLVMGSVAQGRSIDFEVTIDGHPPGGSHGVDVDGSGRGTLDHHRMYQLIRQDGEIADSRFEIEFFEPGAEVFVFTFG